MTMKAPAPLGSILTRHGRLLLAGRCAGAGSRSGAQAAGVVCTGLGARPLAKLGAAGDMKSICWSTGATIVADRVLRASHLETAVEVIQSFRSDTWNWVVTGAGWGQSY